MNDIAEKTSITDLQYRKFYIRFLNECESEVHHTISNESLLFTLLQGYTTITSKVFTFLNNLGLKLEFENWLFKKPKNSILITAEFHNYITKEAFKIK